jgi:hypothetical protein
MMGKDAIDAVGTSPHPTTLAWFGNHLLPTRIDETPKPSGARKGIVPCTNSA